MLLERLIVGIGLTVLFSFKASIYFLIGFFSAMTVVTFVLRPYVAKWNNIRFGMNMLVCISIQIILLFLNKT